MSLVNLTLPALFAGLATLALVLFLLQRLRVRYLEQTVITTLFWKEALEEARARVLVRRFKHPWAYLFVLLIGALMWLGFANPKISLEGKREHVVLIDASASMGRGARFQESVQLVMEHVRSLTGESVRVIFCGARPRTLLQRGESPLLLEARLEALGPQACPSTVDRTLRLLSRSLAKDHETLIVVAGDAAISPTVLALLPKTVHVSRLAPEPSQSGRNRGITALGFARSSSGSFEYVDVLCEISSTDDQAIELSTSIGGKPVQLEAVQNKEGTRTRILLVDVPANGELLSVKLMGSDALVVDDTAQMRLPGRRRIRVVLAKELEASVGPVLRVDPAVLVVDDEPDLRITKGEAQGTATIPTLSFVPIEAQEEAILIYHPMETASEQVLMESFASLGLSEIDAMDIAEASGRRIAIAAIPATGRSIAVWSALLTERFNFIQSRSFPLFIARAVRWLAQVEEDPPFVAAGEDLAGSFAALTDTAGHRLDPAGADFRVPTAGLYHSDDGIVVAASLTDLSSTLWSNASVSQGSKVLQGQETELSLPGFKLDLSLWLAVAVLLLLLVEWYLHGTGRMP